MACGGLLVLAAINLWVFSQTESRVYNDVAEVPRTEFALVLGADPQGDFLDERLQAGLELYQAGKVERLIVSGADYGPDYDEVAYMQDWLVEHGVPAEAVQPDDEGFRTRASIRNVQPFVRTGTPVVIVSQAFHDYRALYLADAKHVDAVAYVAPDAPMRARVFSEVREFLARPWAFLEVMSM
ncbi:MAG: hypothetical protein E1N59_1192 [Puniceicoccaceae bacterium 5H]|nr:MAG: hypothetical protein E1N59_1192 [Puniceicoccaceae bacterium 5H]